MRASRWVVLGAASSMFGAAAWLGCSSPDDGPSAVDAGGQDTSLPDTQPGSDVATPPDDATPPDTEAVSCANYCARVLANCAGDASQYADLATCLAMCKALPLGDAGDTASNTIACRMYHAGAPARQSPSFACPHAGPFGADTCGTRCDSFCTLASAQCPAAFSDAGASCDASCGTAFAYDPDASETPQSPTSGNTLNCRETELEQAFATPAKCAAIPTLTPDAAPSFPCQ